MPIQWGLQHFSCRPTRGRGEWSGRAPIVSLNTVKQQISCGANRALPWDVARIGHPECHSYVSTLIINGNCIPVIENHGLFANFLNDFAYLHQDRRRPRVEIVADFVKAGIRNPGWFLRGSVFLLAHIWRAKRDLWQSRGRAHKMSFFVHNFMNADNLDADRIRACSFMLMTAQGPVSMCEHNERRDEYILKPIVFRRRDGSLASYDPLAKRLDTPLHVDSCAKVTER